MYKYYADVAPAAAKFLRFLLLLPGGDRKEGLEQMLRARSRGRLLQGEADYQLHVIYLWYERQTPRALQLLQSLHERYPANPLFLAQIAEIQDVYQHDVTASLATWRALLAAAREQRANAPGSARCRRGSASRKQLEALHQTDDAIEMLQAVIALRPSAPYGSLSLAYLRLGEAYDRMGERAPAIEAYRAAAAAPRRHPIRTTSGPQAGDRLRRAPDPKRAEAYRLSLEGWRRFEHNDLPGAAAALERLARAQRIRSGRALPLRPRAAGAQGRRGRARAVRARHPRRSQLSAAHPRQRLPRSRAHPRTARPPRRRRSRYYQHRLDAVRRRSRHARRRATDALDTTRVDDCRIVER